MSGEVEGSSRPYRKRYLRLSSYTRYYGLLDSASAVCGFCGQKVAIFSPSLPNVNQPVERIFYGCGARCGKIPFYRVDFVDTKIMIALDKKIKGSFLAPTKISRRKVNKIIAQFQRLEELQKKHRELSSRLPTAGANLAGLIAEIEAVEKEIEDTRRLVTLERTENLTESPLILPFWAKSNGEEIMKLPLTYRREIFWSLITRVRFFSTYLIARTPYFSVSGEISDTEKFGEELTGGTFAINLATHR